MWARALAMGCIALTLGGCSGVLSQVFNNPVHTDHLDEPKEVNKLKRVSGDYRLIRTIRAGKRKDDPKYYEYRVCAETQADAIVTRGAGSTIVVEAGKGLSDTSTQGAILTNQRGAVSDVLRHLTWTLCNANMNGDIDPQDYAKALLALSHDTMVVLQQIARGPSADALPLTTAFVPKTIETPPAGSTPSVGPVTLETAPKPPAATPNPGAGTGSANPPKDKADDKEKK